VKIAMAASIEASSKGNASAAASIAGTASVNDRHERIAPEGSTGQHAPVRWLVRPCPRAHVDHAPPGTQVLMDQGTH